MQHLSADPDATSRDAAAVEDNDWTALDVPGLGSWTPTLRVSVIVPAKDPGRLDALLASLASQSYPAELIECVVVDDGSEPRLELTTTAPATRTVRTTGEGFGAGRARNVGAGAATGDVLVFLDADVIPGAHAVEAHARWHHVADDAVVSGTLRMVDLDQVPELPAELRERNAEAVLGELPWEPVGWTDKLLRNSGDLTARRPDLWAIVVGANVSLRRETYERIGGFTEFGLRGIEDSEFGYKAFIDGCLLVPDAAAHGWHPAERHFSDPARAAATKRRRLPLLLHHVPVDPIRPATRAVAAIVPRVVVQLDGTEAPFEDTVATVDAILGDAGDAVVVLDTDPLHPDAPMLREAFLAEGRVLDRAAVLGGDHGPFDLARTPVHLLLRGPVDLPRGAANKLLRPLLRNQTGVLRLADRDDVVAVTTRAWNRSRRNAGRPPALLPSFDADVLELVARDFGLRLVAARMLDRATSDGTTRGPAVLPLAAARSISELQVLRDALAVAEARSEQLEHRLDRTRQKLDRVQNRRVLRVVDRVGAALRGRR